MHSRAFFPDRRWTKLPGGTATWSDRLTAGCMLVLASAALLKFVDLAEFRASLDSWTLLSTPLRGAIAIAVPVFEAIVAGAWLLGIARGACVALVAGFLLLVSVAFAIQWWAVGPPQCACLGRILRFEMDKHHAFSVLLRNALLLCLLVPGLLGLRRRQLSRGVGGGSVCHSAGFTLVEMLLVVALVGVLIATLMPTLRDARESARRARSLANLRSHATVFSQYTMDFQDQFPHYTDPLATVTVLRAGDLVISVPYFGGFYWWNIALADYAYGGAFDQSSFRVHGSPTLLSTDYWYSATFLAVPAFWNPSTRTGPEQWRSVTNADVLFPSMKVVLFQGGPAPWNPYGPAGTSAAYVDGAARHIRPTEPLSVYSSGEGNWPGTVHHFGLPFHHTIDGVRGRDLNR